MRIFALNTGGTLGMVGKPLRPAKTARELFDGLMIPPGIEMTLEDFRILKDSTNITHTERVEIAERIAVVYGQHDGFLIMHGTDTLERTTAALSMIFKHSLQKPLFVTGAQSPRDKSGSDVKMQVENSLRMLQAFHLNEVVGVFSISLGDVWHGARLRKKNEANPNSLHTPGLSPVAQAWSEIQFGKGLRQKDPGIAVQGLKLDVQWEKNVAPGIIVSADTPPWLLMTHVHPQPRFKGVLLYCEGAGQITNEVWCDDVLNRSYSWIDVIREATERRMYVGIVSPFEDGSVDLSTYELGDEVAKAGGIGMKSLVPAMADFKFRQALAMFPNDPKAIRKYCQTDIVGELLQRTSDIKQSQPFAGL